MKIPFHALIDWKRTPKKSKNEKTTEMSSWESRLRCRYQKQSEIVFVYFATTGVANFSLFFCFVIKLAIEIHWRLFDISLKLVSTRLVNRKCVHVNKWLSRSFVIVCLHQQGSLRKIWTTLSLYDEVNTAEYCRYFITTSLEKPLRVRELSKVTSLLHFLSQSRFSKERIERKLLKKLDFFPLRFSRSRCFCCWFIIVWRVEKREEKNKFHLMIAYDCVVGVCISLNESIFLTHFYLRKRYFFHFYYTKIGHLMRKKNEPSVDCESSEIFHLFITLISSTTLLSLPNSNLR